MDRFAHAHLQAVPVGSSRNWIVTVRVANGDYYELTALDPWHAEQKLYDFARLNRLILQTAGFDVGRSLVRQGAGSPEGLSGVAPECGRHHLNKEEK